MENTRPVFFYNFSDNTNTLMLNLDNYNEILSADLNKRQRELFDKITGHEAKEFGNGHGIAFAFANQTTHTAFVIYIIKIYNFNFGTGILRSPCRFFQQLGSVEVFAQTAVNKHYFCHDCILFLCMITTSQKASLALNKIK